MVKGCLFLTIVYLVFMIGDNNRMNKNMEELFPDHVPNKYRSSNYGPILLIIANAICLISLYTGGN